MVGIINAGTKETGDERREVSEHRGWGWRPSVLDVKCHHGKKWFLQKPWERAEEPCAPKERSQEGRQHECWGQSKSLEFAELNQSPRKCWPLKPTFVGRGSALRQPSPECDVAEDKGGHMSPLVIWVSKHTKKTSSECFEALPQVSSSVPCQWKSIISWRSLLACTIDCGGEGGLSLAPFLNNALVWLLMCPVKQYVFFSFFFFFFFSPFWAVPIAYGGSQARGRIRDTAASLLHSHSNAGAQPHLQPTPQLTATPDP